MKITLSKIFSKLGMVRKYIYYTTKKIELPFYPDRLYVEGTNKCNLSCIMCPTGRNAITREKGTMSFALFKSIIDEMGTYVKTVVLHIWGEPLLDERIFDKICYAKKYGVKTELSTNATLLDRKKTDELLKSGLDILYLCLDGICKETYEKLRRGADYGQTVDNIAYFLKQKRIKGLNKPFVRLQIIDTKFTHNEIEEFEKKWKHQGADGINIKALDTWGDQISEVSNLKVARYKLPKKRYHCPNLWYHAHIYCDGTLVCCDRDFEASYPLGNVKDGVMKVWNGQKMKELRRKHINGQLDDVPSCSRCMEWSWWKPTWFSSWGNIPKKSE